MSPLKLIEIKQNNNNSNILEACISHFKDITKHKELFLNIQNEKAKETKILLKSLYDYIKCGSYNKNQLSSALPELIVDHMDEEQIWQQLELHNEEINDQILTEISKLSVAKRDQINWNLQLTQDDNTIIDGYYNTIDYNELNKDSTEEDNSNDDIESNDDFFDDNDDDAVKPNKKSNEIKIKEDFKPTIVDDKFFKLREMEKFLDAEDKKEMKKTKEDASNISSDEEEIDYFINSSDESIEDENEYNKEDADNFERRNDKSLKFADFFDDEDDKEVKDNGKDENVPCRNDRYMRGSPLDWESAENNRLELRAAKLSQANEELKRKKQELGIEENNSDDICKENHDGKDSKSKVRFNLNKNSYLSDYDSNDENEPLKNKKGKNEKSTYEKRQERLNHRIENLEEAALSEKPWQLKGEIKASLRPRNSLLEEVLEFDASTRPAPIITEDTTLKLEDIIKQRIKDKAFDSVVKKYKQINSPQEFRKKLVLNQEKSKESLSQIYVKEYLTQLDSTNQNIVDKEEQEPKEHKEVRNLMIVLMAKLNAMSNFHFTPKPAIPEAKIITNLPAINIEEVAPVSVSDAAMLAPEEIRKPVKGDIIGKDERTKTDKNRQRRQKKSKQKFIKNNEEKKEKNSVEEGLKLNKRNMNKKLLEKAVKSRNVEKMKVSDVTSFKSSKAFFSKLQDEVTKKVILKTNKSLKRKQNDIQVTAKKLKL